MKLAEENRQHLTAEEYKWAQENVAHYKYVTLVDVDVVMLLLKNGNISIGATIEEAVRQEINKTGETIEINGFETDEINSLLWDE